MVGAYRETVHTFGDEQAPLCGVLCEPAVQRDHQQPTLVFLTAGFLHRVGPHRLHVMLARRLATRGIRSLRLDQGGIGDSATGSELQSPKQRALDDVGAALDFLGRRCGDRRFVLLGLCSGADDAHYVALDDSRVVGIVMLDGYGYRTMGHHLRHYGPRALRPRSVIGFAQRQLRKVAQPLLANWLSLAPIKLLLGDVSAVADVVERPHTSRQQTGAELSGLTSRGVEHLFVYSGGTDYYNYAEQFWAMFRGVELHGRARVEFFGETDHTFMLRGDRERLARVIETWWDERVASVRP